MTKKILFIITLLFFLICLSSSNVFASFDVVDNTGNNLSFPDLPEEVLNHDNFYILLDVSGNYRLYSFDFTPVYHQNCEVYANKDCIEIGSVGYYYAFNPDTMTEWTKINQSGYVHNAGILKSLSGYWYTFIYTSFDIYDTDGNLVFHPPVQEITLAQVLEKVQEEQPAMVLMEVLGLIPVVMIVVVSYLGLRKALAVLLNLLRTS